MVDRWIAFQVSTSLFLEQLFAKNQELFAIFLFSEHLIFRKFNSFVLDSLVVLCYNDKGVQKNFYEMIRIQNGDYD